MSRSLAENISRGRTAIVVARERGIDTAAWERRLAELEREELLAWASHLAEQTLELVAPVRYIEAPSREVTTTRVSYYAGQYLRTIASARIHQSTGGWGSWTPQWWRDREDDALTALRALRGAL